jgi:Tol biopolymer transport system component
MEEKNGHWTSPVVASFSGTSDNGEALFSPDGQKLYFLSTRSPGYKPYGTDIWMTQRTENSWSEPIHLGYPVNSSEIGDWHPSVTNDGTLYFSSRRKGDKTKGDIWRSKLINGQYSTVEDLNEPINSIYHEADPFIAPDESYIIFHAYRPGGYSTRDLYISFRNEDNSWTEPQNMGPGINTSDLEHSPTVTIDGKYLFFGRRNDQSGNGDIYWVNGKVIDELRPSKPDTTSGQHSVSQDATDEQGRIVSSGLHFHQISTPEFTKRKKMMLLK